MKVLLAVDGSPYTRAAARYVARYLAEPGRHEIDLLHVHPPIPYPAAASAVGKKKVDEYQREVSLEALAPAAREFEKAGIEYRSSWAVGDIVEQVRRHVQMQGIDLVVCGSHGQGALANLALGSVVTKLIAALDVPVLVVTRAAVAAKGRKRR